MSGPQEHPDDPLAGILDAALAAVGLSTAYRETVREHLDEPDERWRYCCGGSCDPCIQQIGRAVDAVRGARR